MPSDPLDNMRELAETTREKSQSSRDTATHTLVEMSEADRAHYDWVRSTPTPARMHRATGIMAWLTLLWRAIGGGGGGV